MLKRLTVIVLLNCGLVTLPGCSDQQSEAESAYKAVDLLFDTLEASTQEFEKIASIDHSRLAAAEGAVMPPTRVMIFSNPEINSTILQIEPLAGLDLPFRVLAYSEQGSPSVIYTPSEFLRRRHGLAAEAVLGQYDSELEKVIESLPAKAIVPMDLSAVDKGYGMTTLHSNHGFQETIEGLKTAILAESDTVWFGEIDYQAEAGALGVKLPRLTLLLFGTRREPS